MRAAGDQVAAQAVRPLEEGHLMAAQRRRARGLHAGHATAHHDDALLDRRGLQAIAGGAADLGVDGAARGQAGEEAAQAALVAGYAGTDALGRARLHLLGDVGIGKHRAAQRDGVKLAGRDGVLVHLHVAHAGAHDDGHLDGNLRLGGKVNHVAALEVHGRAGVIEGVVDARVHVKAVVAVGLQDLADADALLERAELLALARDGALHPVLHVALEAQAHRHGEVGTARGLDALDDLDRGTQAVLEAAAILVLAVVGHRGGKLVEQVAPVDRVDLDAVEACLLRHGRALDHLVDLELDLLDREHRRRLVGRAEDRVSRGAVEARVVATEAHGELDEEARVVGTGPCDHRVGGGQETRGIGEDAIAQRAGGVDLGVGREGTGLEQAEAALGAADEVLDAVGREGAVGRQVRPGRNGRHHEAVFNGQLANLKGAGQGGKRSGHGRSSPPRPAMRGTQPIAPTSRAFLL